MPIWMVSTCRCSSNVPTAYAFIKKKKKKKKKRTHTHAHACMHAHAHTHTHTNNTSHEHHSISPSLIFFYLFINLFIKCTLRIGRYIFYHNFYKYFWKALGAVKRSTFGWVVYNRDNYLYWLQSLEISFPLEFEWLETKLYRPFLFLLFQTKIHRRFKIHIHMGLFLALW